MLVATRRTAALCVAVCIYFLFSHYDDGLQSVYRLAHTQCQSYRIPPRRLGRYKWSAQNRQQYIVFNSSAYALPDYVNCPKLTHLVGSDNKRRLSPGKRALQLPPNLVFKDFSELDPLIVEHACHYGLQNTHDVTPSQDVCVVVRFYNQQLDTGNGHSLKDCLTSLAGQQYKNLNITVVNTDSLGEGDELAVRELLHSVAVDAHFTTFPNLTIQHRPDGSVDHRPVWYATEKAIASCPDTARWLLVTNGDNTYHPTFMNHLDDRFDLIAFDFYSRHRPVWSRGECDAYGRRHGLNLGCLPNNLRLCETDLGSVVFNLHRWRREKRRFSLHESDNGSEDGLMIESLLLDGWSHKRISGVETGECLFDHNPNYHSCMRASATSVWDDKKQVCLNLSQIQEMGGRRRHGLAERCVM